METLDSTSSCSSSASNLQSPSSKTPQPPPSVIRLWRPAAQRNLRNQWSKLASYRQQWTSTASKGRSHATDLVNSYLSQRQLQTFCFNLWFFEFYGPFGYWGNSGKDKRDAVEKCNLKMFDSLPIFVIFILFVSNRSNLARKFENIIFNFPEISQQPNRG